MTNMGAIVITMAIAVQSIGVFIFGIWVGGYYINTEEQLANANADADTPLTVVITDDEMTCVRNAFGHYYMRIDMDMLSDGARVGAGAEIR